MVQIIPDNKQGFGRNLLKGLQQAFPEALSEHKQNKELSQENRALMEKFGVNLEGIRDPKLRYELATKGSDANRRQSLLQSLQEKLMADHGIQQGQQKTEEEFSQEEITPRQLTEEQVRQDPYHLQGLGKAANHFAEQLGANKNAEGEQPGQVAPLPERPQFAEQISQRQQKQQSSNQPQQRQQQKSVIEQLFDNASPDEQLALLSQFPDEFKAIEDKKKQQREDEKFEFEKEKVQEQQSTKRYEVNSKFMDSIYDAAKASQSKLSNLEEMERLNESGQLSGTGIINALNLFGIDNAILQNPSNDVYTKSALNLTSGITNEYGSRILASEFSTFLKRIPTLMNTEEGRREIISSLKTLEQIPKIELGTMQQILDDADRNGTKIPLNLRGEVVKRSKSQVENVFQDLKSRNGRAKVSQGSKITPNVIQKYLAMSRRDDGTYDDKKAERLAREDGYNL